MRGAGDGRWPAPGWDSAYDWEDYLPFEQLPYVYNPAEGLIVTANQAVIGPQYQPLLTTDWGFGHRGNRIHDLLAEAIAAGPISVSDMERMLFDNYHPLAEVLVPALLAAPQTPLSKDEQTALDLLRTWDYQQPAGGKAGTRRRPARRGGVLQRGLAEPAVPDLRRALPTTPRAGVAAGLRW